MIKSKNFISRHKKFISSFIRNRKLNFSTVLTLIFRKSSKSLQLVLNEFSLLHDKFITITSSAYCQARKKFLHTAFIELNDFLLSDHDQIIDVKTWHGYRCIAFDASQIILPNEDEVKSEYGSIIIKNHKLKTEDNRHYSSAMFECGYDVLNNIIVSSRLAHNKSYEVDLAIDMLNDLSSNSNELLIYDRHYASYKMIASLVKCKKNFIIRLPSNSFKVSQSMFKGLGSWSKEVTIFVPSDKSKEISSLNLAHTVKVRLVRVKLKTGSYEVLVTSLRDSTLTRNDFKMLYGLRWGIETFFGTIKGRLSLENFTGKSLESVKQDFYSTIFLCNLESIITHDIKDDLNTVHKYSNISINKAISFNAIKNVAFDLIKKGSNEANLDKTFEKLRRLFLTNIYIKRHQKNVPKRKVTSPRVSLNYQKRIKKNVF